MKYFILLLIFNASTGWAETLEFRNSSTYFTGKLEAKTFSASSSRGEWSTAVTKCNEGLIQDFWKNTKAQLEGVRFKTPLKKDSKTTFAINKKSYRVLPIDRKIASLSLLPQRLTVLKYQAAKKCK